MSWKLTVRSGSKVTRSFHPDVGDALAQLEARAGELAASAPDRVVDAKFKRFAPADQVIARLELSGPERFAPSARAGLDVRGDGSLEAYRGRLRRAVIEPRHAESAFAALCRTLTEAPAV